VEQTKQAVLAIMNRQVINGKFAAI